MGCDVASAAYLLDLGLGKANAEGHLAFNAAELQRFRKDYKLLSTNYFNGNKFEEFSLAHNEVYLIHSTEEPYCDPEIRWLVHMLVLRNTVLPRIAIQVEVWRELIADLGGPTSPNDWFIRELLKTGNYVCSSLRLSSDANGMYFWGDRLAHQTDAGHRVGVLVDNVLDLWGPTARDVHTQFIAFESKLEKAITPFTYRFVIAA